MARDYGRISTGFWNHPKIRKCSDRGKLLANYLMTGPHSNSIGAYLLPDAYVADDLGWSLEAVSKAFAELFEIGFATRFDDGRHVVIRDFLEWNPIENPNVATGAARILDQLNDDPALLHVFNGMKPYAQHFKDRWQTIAERFRNIEPEPEIEPEPDTEMDSCAAPLALAPVALLPTNKIGVEYPVSEDQVREFEEAYPAVDVPQQLREMRSWLLTNSTKRKTFNGMAKFINSWLGKEQDRGGSRGKNTGPETRVSAAFGGAGDALDVIRRRAAQNVGGGCEKAEAAGWSEPRAHDRTHGVEAPAASNARANPATAFGSGSHLSVATPRPEPSKSQIPDFLRGSETPDGGSGGVGLQAIPERPNQQILPDTGPAFGSGEGQILKGAA